MIVNRRQLQIFSMPNISRTSATCRRFPQIASLIIHTARLSFAWMSTDLPPISGICRRFIKTCRRVKNRAKIVQCELGITFWGWLFVTYAWYQFSIDIEVLHSDIVPKPNLWYRAIPTPDTSHTGCSHLLTRDQPIYRFTDIFPIFKHFTIIGYRIHRQMPPSCGWFENCAQDRYCSASEGRLDNNHGMQVLHLL